MSGGSGGRSSFRVGAQGDESDEGHEEVPGGGQAEELHGCASGGVEQKLRGALEESCPKFMQLRAYKPDMAKIALIFFSSCNVSRRSPDTERQGATLSGRQNRTKQHLAPVDVI